MFDVRFSITGIEELDRKLKTLPMRLQKKALRQGVRAGAKVLAAAARSKVPVKSGTYKASFKVKAAKRSRRNKDAVRANVMTGESLFKGKGFYGAFLEYGWQAGSRKEYPIGQDNEGRHKLGRLWIKERIPVEGKHYLKAAFDASQSAALAATREVIQSGIFKEAAAYA